MKRILLILPLTLFIGCSNETKNVEPSYGSSSKEGAIQTKENTSCSANSPLGGSCSASGPNAFCSGGLFKSCCDANTEDGNDCTSGVIKAPSQRQINNNQDYQNYVINQIGTPNAMDAANQAQALMDSAQHSDMEGYLAAYNEFVVEHNEMKDSNQIQVNDWLRSNFEDATHKLEDELEVRQTVE